MAKKSKRPSRKRPGGKKQTQKAQKKEIASKIGSPGYERPSKAEFRKRDRDRAAAREKHRKAMNERQERVNKGLGI